MDEVILTTANFLDQNLNYHNSIELKRDSGTFLNSISVIEYAGLNNVKDLKLSDTDAVLISDNNFNSYNLNNILNKPEKPYNFTSYLKFENNFVEYLSGGNYFQASPEPSYFYFNFSDNDTVKVGIKNLNSRNYQYLDVNDDVILLTSVGHDFYYTLNDEKLCLFTSDYKVVGFVDNVLKSFYSTSPYIFNTIGLNKINENISLADSFHNIYKANTVDNLYTYPFQNQKLIQILNKADKDNVNFVQLKNNVSNKNFYNLTNFGNSCNFRQYTNLQYNKDLNLLYDTNSYEIEITSDTVFEFTLPSNINLYSHININDLNLIQNGAIGGNTPLNSDKIFKKLNGYTKTVNTGDVLDLENGEYLCSWLYYNYLEPTKSVWLDRYYLPDQIKKLDALAASTYDKLSKLIDEESEFNLLLSTYSDSYRIGDVATGVFDVISNLTFEPYCSYTYYHIGSISSKTLINSYIENILVDGLEFTNNNTNIFDGSNYGNTAPILLENQKDFTWTFDLEISNPYNLNGHQIIGNLSNNKGMGFVLDEYYSPFLYTFKDDTVYVLHCDTKELLSKFTIENDVKFIIQTNPFEKYYVVDVENIIYEINTNNIVINKNQINKTISLNAYFYKNNKIYFLYTVGFGPLISPAAKNYFVFDVKSFEVTAANYIDGKNYAAIFVDGNNELKFSEVANADFNSKNKIFYVENNALYKNNFTSPLLSCTGDETIKDFLIDENDIIYVLTDKKLLKISDEVKPIATFCSFDTSNFSYTGHKLLINRYNKDNVNYKYISICVNVGTTLNFYNFDESLNYYTVQQSVGGGLFDMRDVNNLKNIKYQYKPSRELKFKTYLQNLYNKSDILDIIFKIPLENLYKKKNTFTVLLNNSRGNLSVYLNDTLVNTRNFNANKYYYSNDLISKKIYVGASLYDNDVLLKDKLDGNYFMSKNFTLDDLKIYDFCFSYYDILARIRQYEKTSSAYLVLPLKTRSYIENVKGFFKVNKNIRKSEYYDILLHSELLTDEEKSEVLKFINNLKQS